MKPKHLNWEDWQRLLAVVVGYAKAWAPEPIQRYMHDRLVSRDRSEWSSYDGGWIDEKFEQWEAQASSYINKGSVVTDVVAGLETIQRLQVEALNTDSKLHTEIGVFFSSLPEEYSSFRQLQAKNDAIGAVIGSAVAWSKAALRPKLRWASEQVSAAIEALIVAAEYQRKNRLEAEYFPFKSVLQQLAKQPPGALAPSRGLLPSLVEAISALPFDDARDKKAREGLAALVNEVDKSAVS